MSRTGYDSSIWVNLSENQRNAAINQAHNSVHGVFPLLIETAVGAALDFLAQGLENTDLAPEATEMPLVERKAAARRVGECVR